VRIGHRHIGAEPQTTAQQLAAIIKSARNIMRKDKGLNGDLDRLPMLTWVMFLKFLDDMERLRETEAELAGTPFRPDIAPPYRWRDWAGADTGLTGDDLIAFVNNNEAVRADGRRGAGLFFYLRGLQSADGGDRRNVIATVFRGVQNRMVDGHLLRDVIDLMNGIHFDSSKEMHTLSWLYESLLKQMRDAAGDAGEFYTPRPVVRCMVRVLDPQLGETVLDPACGTGGFLVEAFGHLAAQYRSVDDRRTLQTASLQGGEPKPLQDADLAGRLAWWHAREEDEHAWRGSAGDVLQYDGDGRLIAANLDRKNPHSREAMKHRDPAELIAEIERKERQVLEILDAIKAEIATAATP